MIKLAIAFEGTVHKDSIMFNKGETMLEKIKEDINERMAEYGHSAVPIDDEVYIAWLIAEVERLTKELKKKVYPNVFNKCNYKYYSKRKL